MKINQIINETTTAGAVATVASPMGAPQRRTSEDMTIKGLQPVDKVMKGKAKKKGPYANSLVESKMKDLAYDLEHLDSGNFVKKYGKSKDDLKAALSKNKQKQPQQKPVSEAELQEDDLIVIPGMSSKRKNGFVPRGQSRVDHEIEMAKSDLIQCIKNAESILDCIQDRTEDEGLEGWIQEKIIKASDYLNAVAENLESKKLEMVHPGGVIAGGGVGESKTGLKKSTLASYKKKAAAQASELDRQAFSGDDPDAKKKIEKSNKRFSGIVRATKKEFGESVAEAKSPEEFLGQIKKMASTTKQSAVGSKFDELYDRVEVALMSLKVVTDDLYSDIRDILTKLKIKPNESLIEKLIQELHNRSSNALNHYDDPWGERGLTEGSEDIWLTGYFEGEVVPIAGKMVIQNGYLIDISRVSSVPQFSSFQKPFRQAQIKGLKMDKGDGTGFIVDGTDFVIVDYHFERSSKGKAGIVAGTAYVKIVPEGLKEGQINEIDRRGFLKGLGAAALGSITGSALADPRDKKLYDLHIEMMEKNPKYEQEWNAKGLRLSRGIIGDAKVNNEKYYKEMEKLLKKYGALRENVSMAEEKLDEKFKSQQQAKLMYAVAGDKGVAKKTGVSQKVAKEFVKKSHGQKVSSLPKKVAKKD